MSLVEKKLRIGGMTCINCQDKIQKKLKNTAGISEVSVSYSAGIAKLTYDSDLISLNDIIRIIEKTGYEVLKEKEALPKTIVRQAGLLALMIFLYLLLERLGLLNVLVPSRLADAKMGYGMLFIMGLLTSVHCIAMCGGINLTQCIPRENTSQGNNGKRPVFGPAIQYNLGRVISYTVVGFILGFIGLLLGGGSGAGPSALLQGIVKIIAGVFMIIMGINMLGIFPWLRKVPLRIPKFLAVKIARKKGKSRQPLAIGLLNGLMPCGPLQSMQIVALASGNPLSGALSMLFFSLGTVPLMLGLGSLVSALGKKFTRIVMSVGAVLVVVLGLTMLSQGGSFSGLLLPEELAIWAVVLSVLGVAASVPVKKRQYKTAALIAAGVVLVVGGTFGSRKLRTVTLAENVKEAAEPAENLQVVNSTLAARSYPSITVQAGIPVKWVIDAPVGSINGCNYKMLIRDFGIEYSFQQGENVIEFTPTEAGTYSYTCWMGMIRGIIYVVDGTGAEENPSGKEAETEAVVSEEGIRAGSCCG